MSNKDKLKTLQDRSRAVINETNMKIDELGQHTDGMYNALIEMQDMFDIIRSIPSDKRIEYEELKKIRLDWASRVEEIEKDYNNAVIKDAGLGAAGVGAGVAVAALGPTAAMGVATTFGVASTGTAISALSGAAATNAALAWLGGGALAAGGGGIAAGNVFLALAGPVGIAIAGVAILSGGLLFWKAKSERERLENIFILITERDINKYKLAIVELNERIVRIDSETQLLREAIKRISEFGTDYNQMTEEQQYELGSYVNLMAASTQLLVNPIFGLKPEYDEAEFEKYVEFRKIPSEKIDEIRMPIIALSNFLYKIGLDSKDKTILWKYLVGNKDILPSVDTNNLDISVMERVQDALICKDKQYDDKLTCCPQLIETERADYSSIVKMDLPPYKES